MAVALLGVELLEGPSVLLFDVEFVLFEKVSVEFVFTVSEEEFVYGVGAGAGATGGDDGVDWVFCEITWTGWNSISR